MSPSERPQPLLSIGWHEPRGGRAPVERSRSLVHRALLHAQGNGLDGKELLKLGRGRQAHADLLEAIVKTGISAFNLARVRHIGQVEPALGSREPDIEKALSLLRGFDVY